MGWYVLQVMTGTERDVCTALRRKGVQARAPAQRMEIRRWGQWQTEERLLLPGYVFVLSSVASDLICIFSPLIELYNFCFIAVYFNSALAEK